MNSSPQPNSWSEFWQQEKVFQAHNWSKNMEIFLAASHKIFPLTKKDKLLDMGCGPGTLEGYLVNKVMEIHGLDISSAYIDFAQKKFAGKSHIHFHVLVENASNLNFLEGQTFDKILCLSVIQYFKEVKEVLNLVQEVKKVSRSGSLFLIADICMQGGFLRNLYAMLKKAWQEKYLWAQLQFLLRAKFSSYAQVHKKQGLLEFTETDLSQLAESIRQLASCQVEILSLPLTLSENRKHLLIRF